MQSLPLFVLLSLLNLCLHGLILALDIYVDVLRCTLDFTPMYFPLFSSKGLFI